MAIEITKKDPRWGSYCHCCESAEVKNNDFAIRIGSSRTQAVVVLCREHLAELAKAIEEALDE